VTILSLLRGRKIVVDLAKLLPCLGRVDSFFNSSGIFGKNNSKTSLQMPVLVAVQEPWARVISPETDGHGSVTSSIAGINSVTDRRVNLIAGTGSGLNDLELMTVQVEGVVRVSTYLDGDKGLGREDNDLWRQLTGLVEASAKDFE